ncbi:protoporphyrinogen oxidase HemJ [soil metagenome]
MIGFLDGAYPWIKAGHVVFVIFWMAGLFMLPRYLVYQQEALAGSAEDLLWIERCRKIRTIILTPSMILVWVLGLLLAANIGMFSGASGLGWLHLKFALVLGLSGYHGWAVSYSKKLAAGKRTLTGKQLRLLNEIPGVAVALIVILVMVRPF